MTRTFTLVLALTLLSIEGTAWALEKETSLVTGKKVGQLAVAGKLLIDVHAEFMMSRTLEKDTVLHWYNMGVSGGGAVAKGVGGSFGDFGLHVPHDERDEKYPHAVMIGEVPAAKFDGGDIMKGNFVIDAPAAGREDLAIEVWVHDETPQPGEVIFGWQSEDGKKTSGTLSYPKAMKGSDKIQLITLNCTAGRQTWYVNGKKVASGRRAYAVAPGHKMVLGGASSLKPSFKGSLVAFRLHTEAMTEQEIEHNAAGGPMLGTELHDWWRTEGDAMWRVDRSGHFRNCVSRKRLSQMTPQQRKEFENRLPGMFELAEKVYHLYSERLAMRSSVVSAKAKYRGDGIKYTIPNQPADGNWMGWDGKLGFGWACQGAGHINPHELVHGWQAQTGGTMQGNYWEAHANFPQTYAGIYQTLPPAFVSRVSMFFPANGRCYYHDRLMFEHLAQTPEYGPMFISKLWYDAGTAQDLREYPWTAFSRFDPDPSTDLSYEWTRMLQKCITWDYQIFGGRPADLYKKDGDWTRPEMKRYGQVLLEKIPYDPQWWRAPKEMTPQQLGYNICPLNVEGRTATAQLDGYISEKRGSDWRAAFVGVQRDGSPVYGDIVKTGETARISTRGLEKLYLVVCAMPTKLMAIEMTGDFRSFEQEKFPYKLKLNGCSPQDVLENETPRSGGSRHRNGGGYVAQSAKVDLTAYVGRHAQVLGKSQVLGRARIEGHAVVRDSTVRDHAVVSDHALVEGGSVVRDHAKVRDWGRVQRGATLKDFAKVIEHGTQHGKPCGGYAVIKGVAVSSGNVRGNPMIDGSYLKSNDVDKGKWFTWSWGKGKNPGEIDEDFGGIYMRMLFDTPHEWMAPDDFGATWGYLVGNPTFDSVAARRSSRGANAKNNGALLLNGKDQFVELQNDVADMTDISIKADVLWRGGSHGAILDCSNDRDSMFLGVERGVWVFSITKGRRTQSLTGPRAVPGRMTEILVVLSGDVGKLLIDGKEVDVNPKMSLNPDDVGATACYLGRDSNGNFFKGAVDRLEIYSVPLMDDSPPTPDPAQLAVKPLFVNPTTVLMRAEAGIDPLGTVEYRFEEVSGAPGATDSDWTTDPLYQDTGLTPDREYRYTVTMRDKSGNTTKPSAPAAGKWEGGKAFQSADGKTIVIETENFMRSVEGRKGGKDRKWELTTDKTGYSGNGMMKVMPDRGLQIDTDFESQSPRLDYLVDFPRKGKYTVWMRSWNPHPGSDSVFIGVDMKPTDRPFHAGNGRLGWKAFEVEVETPGLHTLNLWMREDGCTADKLILTWDQSMPDPRGAGPAESAMK